MSREQKAGKRDENSHNYGLNYNKTDSSSQIQDILNGQFTIN